MGYLVRLASEEPGESGDEDFEFEPGDNHASDSDEDIDYRNYWISMPVV